jgi:hypothetical protein
MIWLTWRQYRVAMIIGLVILVALSLVFVMDANTLNAALQQHHFTHCFDTSADYIPCGIMIVPGNTAQWRTLAAMLLPWFPLVIGFFLGAPLLPNEYDQRTHLFAWTQSVSPTRWLSIKLVIIGGATLIGFGLLSCITTWWGVVQDVIAFSPWDTFMIRGSVPVANALFSLMVGVMIGTFIRRTRSAMALTLVLLALIQAGISMGYPYLLPPSSQLDYHQKIQQQHLVGKFGGNSQDLIVSQQYVEPNGNPIQDLNAYCGITPNTGAGDTQQEFNQCINEHHIKPLVAYQRFDERFWPLQLVTTALLLVLTAFVTVITYWQLRRRTF